MKYLLLNILNANNIQRIPVSGKKSGGPFPYRIFSIYNFFIPVIFFTIISSGQAQERNISGTWYTPKGDCQVSFFTKSDTL